MPTLRIIVKGSLGEIAAHSFISTLEHSLAVLHDIDRRVSQLRLGSTHWVIAGLGTSSTYVELATRQLRGKEDYPKRVAEYFTDGIRYLKQEGRTPPYFSADNIAVLQQILRDFSKNGAHGVGYSLDDGRLTAELSTENEPDIAKLIGVAYKAIGSIEGKIEVVSLRRRSKRFSITQSRTQRAIRCNLTVELEDDVIRAMHERRRVIVTGVISYNEKGEPVAVQVKQPIRFLKAERELPSIEDLRGSDKNLTGAMTSEEYFRSLGNG
jgi:hypothetical protein